MSEQDILGNRMKRYESISDIKLSSYEDYVVIRLDGRAFHTFTSGLPRPFCHELHELMCETTKHLIGVTNALIGYTQSDEISLVLSPRTDFIFSGRVQKLCSILAASASVFFNKKLPEYLPAKTSAMPLFDCRVFAVDKNEAANALLWREQDAIKNSVQSLAQANFSHKSLQGLDTEQLKDKLLKEKEIDWNKLPINQQRGSYFKRVMITRKFSTEEQNKLPPKHEARTNPDLLVERHDIIRAFLPPLQSLNLNEKIAVLFS